MNFNKHQSGIPRREFIKMGIKGGIALAAVPPLLMNLSSCSGGLNDDLSADVTNPDTLKKIIAKALEKGGDFAEVYIENRISRTINMEESLFKSGVFGISKGAGVRVISGDKTGYAYTDEVTFEKLISAAETASYIARGGKIIQPMNIQEVKRDSFITVKVPLDTVADAKRLDVMKRANQAALDYDPKVKMTIIEYYDEMRSRVIANSEGLYVKSDLPLLFLVVNAMAAGNNTRHMGRQRISRHSGFEMFDELTPENIARECAREAVVMLEAKDSPAGIMDVVIQNGWGGVLVHEAVGHPLEADNIAREIGAFTGKLGKKVANDIVTMVDDGSIPNARGTINFDDEGTQTKKNVLIRNGVLEKYMTDILSAKQINMERTGNGRRESFRYIPIPRMTNTYIDNGKDNPADIVASTQKGIYVQSLSGGSVNPITGMFNFTCRESYLIENGKKTTPVKGATLTGYCMDIINNIDAIGNDLSFGPGICGKGQDAEVTAGQPTVRIRSINVGGTKAS